MKLKNKIAVVTGASSGLGYAVTTALLKKKVQVYGIARSKSKLDEMKEQFGGLFVPVTLDLTSEKGLSDWMKTTFSENHFPQILINNAGTSQFANVDELSAENWHQMINVNLSAVHFLTAAIVPFMKQNEASSHIINIGSILGKTSGAQKSAYSATKFAIQGYSEALFKELRGFNIKVTCFNPGSIKTDFFDSSGIKSNEKMLHPDELAETLVYLLETPDNVLIDELTVRPLRP